MRFNQGKIGLVGLALLAAQGSVHAVDALSLGLATGQQVQMIRLGAQWNWERRWMPSNGSHIGAYWDLSLAQWRGTKFQSTPGAIQHINSVGLTPFLRYQQDSKKGLYAEGGIGIHLLSSLYDNDNIRLSTSFQFGDEVGIGYVFANKLDLGLRLQHFSNGGLKEPNDGIDFTTVRLMYAF